MQNVRKKQMETNRLYRYIRGNSYDWHGTADLKLVDYNIMSETPKGYWIFAEYRKKWVAKEGKKRYAYPTPEEAKENFKARTERCVKILESRLKEAKSYLNLVKEYRIQKLKFGDYILFQKYTHKHKEDYEVTKPILAIYLGAFVADQTIGFNYVRWNNDNHTVYVTNEYVTKYPTCKEVDKIESFIEWDDYIDILGSWEIRPSWKEILVAYRKQNVQQTVNIDDIDWK